MQVKKNREGNYFFYMLMSFVAMTISLYFYDTFFLQSDNMNQFKEDREAYYSDLQEKDSGSIKVGIVWPFMIGDAVSDYFKEGILLAQKEINEKGVLGKKIEVDFQDDRWEQEKAESIAKKYARDSTVLAVIAHDDETLAIPASITYDYSGLIMISPAVSYPLFTRKDFNYIFRNTASDIDIAEVLTYASHYLNFNKVVVLSFRHNRYSETLAQNFMENAILNNIKIIYDNQIVLAVDDESEKKSISKKSNELEIISDIFPSNSNKVDYDAIFIAGIEESVVPFIKKAREKGIYAPFITGDALDIPNLESYGKEMDDIIIASLFNVERVNEKTQNFVQTFKKEYGFLPDTWAAQGYDAMMLLVQAIKNANSLNPELITTELHYMRNFQSIFGPYSLTPRGDVIGRKLYVKIFKDGHFNYINFK